MSWLVLALAFHTAWLAQPLGWPLRIFHVFLVVIAVVRPGDAVLVFAGLAPLTTTLTVLLQSPRAGRSLLEAMLWALATGLLVRAAPGIPSRLRVPALLLATVALGSAIVSIAGDPIFITGYPGLWAAATDLMSEELFQWIPPWIPLNQALAMSLALFVAVGTERAVRMDPQLGVRLVRMLVIGHGAAVAVSLSRLASAALRDGEFVSVLIGMLAAVRYYSQYDVNAAGSTLVIVACAGLGLIGGPHRLVTAGAVLLVIAGVWLTGSRAALVALIAVVLLNVLVGAIAAGNRRAWLTSGATIAAVAVTAVALYTYYPTGRNIATNVAYEARVIMLRTAWRIGMSHPVYGVGIGRMPDRAPEFGSTDMLRHGGPRGATENAHNQYLQFFAELGLLGVAAFTFLISSIGGPAALKSDDPLLSWTSWGLLATLLTWLLGHPLLVPEAAVIFWLFVGIVAGRNAAPAVHARAWRLTRVCGVSLAVLVGTLIPLRASNAARSAYLEHRGYGVSPLWHHDAEVSYRSAGATFALFLPSAAVVTIPLRTAGPPGNTALIEIFLRGKLIQRVEVSPAEWRPIKVLLPRSDRQFERVEFVVVGAPADSADQELVRVGKATDVRLASPGGR